MGSSPKLKSFIKTSHTMNASRVSIESVTKRLVEDSQRRVEKKVHLAIQQKEREKKDIPSFTPVLLSRERSYSNKNKN